MDNLSADIRTKKISRNLYAMIITINRYSKEPNESGSHLTPVLRVKIHNMKGKVFVNRSAASYWAGKYRATLNSPGACQDLLDWNATR